MTWSETIKENKLDQIFILASLILSLISLMHKPVIEIHKYVYSPNGYKMISERIAPENNSLLDTTIILSIFIHLSIIILINFKHKFSNWAQLSKTLKLIYLQLILLVITDQIRYFISIIISYNASLIYILVVDLGFAFVDISFNVYMVEIIVLIIISTILFVMFSTQIKDSKEESNEKLSSLPRILSYVFLLYVSYSVLFSFERILLVSYLLPNLNIGFAPNLIYLLLLPLILWIFSNIRLYNKFVSHRFRYKIKKGIHILNISIFIAFIIFSMIILTGLSNQFVRYSDQENHIQSIYIFESNFVDNNTVKGDVKLIFDTPYGNNYNFTFSFNFDTIILYEINDNDIIVMNCYNISRLLVDGHSSNKTEDIFGGKSYELTFWNNKTYELLMSFDESLLGDFYYGLSWFFDGMCNLKTLPANFLG